MAFWSLARLVSDSRASESDFSARVGSVLEVLRQGP